MDFPHPLSPTKLMLSPAFNSNDKSSITGAMPSRRCQFNPEVFYFKQRLHQRCLNFGLSASFKTITDKRYCQHSDKYRQAGNCHGIAGIKNILPVRSDNLSPTDNIRVGQSKKAEARFKQYCRSDHQKLLAPIIGGSALGKITLNINLVLLEPEARLAITYSSSRMRKKF